MPVKWIKMDPLATVAHLFICMYFKVVTLKNEFCDDNIIAGVGIHCNEADLTLTERDLVVTTL